MEGNKYVNFKYEEYLCLTHIVIPEDSVRRRTGADSAVKVNISSLVY